MHPPAKIWKSQKLSNELWQFTNFFKFWKEGVNSSYCTVMKVAGNLLKRGQALCGSHYFLTGYKRLGTLFLGLLNAKFCSFKYPSCQRNNRADISVQSMSNSRRIQSEKCILATDWSPNLSISMIIRQKTSSRRDAFMVMVPGLVPAKRAYQYCETCFPSIGLPDNRLGWQFANPT